MQMKKIVVVTVALVLALALAFPTVVLVSADPGDKLGEVVLPGNGGLSVAGTFDGTYYMTVDGPDDVLQIYLPCVGDPCNATPVSTKNIVDGAGDPVIISAIAWDPIRKMVWGTYDDDMWLMDRGDPTVSDTIMATLQFQCVVPPADLCVPPVGDPFVTLVDGLAWDPNDDTLWWSPDVDCSVYHFAPDGTYLGKVTPLDAAGAYLGLISGVVVGSGNTLYIGRDGAAEIRMIDKTTGATITQFATTAGRVEDLTCDPVTYWPKEAILSKDAYDGLYEAFECETGTCPLTAVVGGEVYAVDAPAASVADVGTESSTSVLWIGLGAAFVLAIGGGVFVLRRQRAN
jgi:hypothetical protein